VGTPRKASDARADERGERAALRASRADVAASSGGTDLSRRGLALAAAVGAAAAAAPAGAEDESFSRMIDSDNFLAPEARTYLEILCRKVEAITGTKMFVIAPPRRARMATEDLGEYLGEVKKRFGIDKSSVVINVGSNANLKQYVLHGVTRGLKIKEKYQFKLTSDQLEAVVKRFGTQDSVQRFNPQGQKWKGVPSAGFDKSVVLTAEQVGACITLAGRDKSFECNLSPLKDERVREVLESMRMLEDKQVKDLACRNLELHSQEQVLLRTMTTTSRRRGTRARPAAPRAWCRRRSKNTLTNSAPRCPPPWRA